MRKTTGQESNIVKYYLAFVARTAQRGDRKHDEGGENTNSTAPQVGLKPSAAAARTRIYQVN